METEKICFVVLAILLLVKLFNLYAAKQTKTNGTVFFLVLALLTGFYLLAFGNLEQFSAGGWLANVKFIQGKKTEVEVTANEVKSYAADIALMKDRVAKDANEIEATGKNIAAVHDEVVQMERQLAPRKISQEQHDKFRDEVKTVPRLEIVVFKMSWDGETQEFASNLRSLLDDSGYASHGPMPLTGGIYSNMPKSSVHNLTLFFTAYSNQDLPTLQALVVAFGHIGLNVAIVRGGDSPPGGAQLVVTDKTGI